MEQGEPPALAGGCVPFRHPPADAGGSPADMLAVVVIGRNEGERLRRCLQSLGDRRSAAVYVDSGSTDGSAALAKSIGVEVVELDSSRPFTAARGRNAGFDRALELHPHAEFVQFV